VLHGLVPVLLLLQMVLPLPLPLLHLAPVHMLAAEIHGNAGARGRPCACGLAVGGALTLTGGEGVRLYRCGGGGAGTGTEGRGGGGGGGVGAWRGRDGLSIGGSAGGIYTTNIGETIVHIGVGGASSSLSLNLHPSFYLRISLGARLCLRLCLCLCLVVAPRGRQPAPWHKHSVCVPGWRRSVYRDCVRRERGADAERGRGARCGGILRVLGGVLAVATPAAAALSRGIPRHPVDTLTMPLRVIRPMGVRVGVRRVGNGPLREDGGGGE
jgi:hypothetical protein